MSDDLTRDEFDALGQVSRREHRSRPSACVARNAKRLTGIKLMEYGRDGQLSLTEKGKQTLFIYRCIEHCGHLLLILMPVSMPMSQCF